MQTLAEKVIFVLVWTNLSNSLVLKQQGVLQSKVAAEWNGHGDLQTFARRAHRQWGQKHGVPTPVG